MSTEKTSRRGFLDTLLGAGLTAFLGAVFYPVVRYMIPPRDAGASVSSVSLGSLDDFPPDSGKIFRFGNKPGLLVRSPSGELKAFEATCTHLDCIVQYRRDLGLIWCACHNGRYDLNGTNIGGPPPRPLTGLKIDVREGQVFVSRA